MPIVGRKLQTLTAKGRDSEGVLREAQTLQPFNTSEKSTKNEMLPAVECSSSYVPEGHVCNTPVTFLLDAEAAPPLARVSQGVQLELQYNNESLFYFFLEHRRLRKTCFTTVFWNDSEVVSVPTNGATGYPHMV